MSKKCYFAFRHSFYNGHRKIRFGRFCFSHLATLQNRPEIKKSKIQLGEKEKECGCGGIKCAEVNQEVEVEVTQECRVNL